MIKRILIPLDSSAHTDAAVEYGCYISRYFDAELTGMTVLDIPGIERSVGSVPTGAANYSKLLREAKKRRELIKKEEKEHINALLERFTTKCKKENVRHRVSRDQGLPHEVIIQKSLFFDFLIIGQCIQFQYDKKDKSTDSLDKILDSAVTPILAVPNNFKPFDKLRAVLAFDGSEPAVRAMHQFTSVIPTNSPEFTMTIVVGDDDKEKADYLLENAERYLNAHGFKDVQKDWITKNIINAFEEKYSIENDLIILGMHSKRMLADFFVGSLSKYLINKGQIPVFLGQ